MAHDSSHRPKRPKIAGPATPIDQLGDEHEAGRGMASEGPPTYVPKLEMRDIFHQMIADELRNGRLTRERRKRIIRYAAQLGLSAVEAGRLITTCREQILERADSVERRHVLKMVEPERERIPIAFKLALVVALAIAVDLLLFGWPW